jgi:hypothetical protein
MLKTYITLFGVFWGLSSACEFDECQNIDFGSCGNACCRLNVEIKGETTVDVMNKLNATIVGGGPDALYIPMQTAGEFVFSDLRPYNITPDFLGQAWHTTVNGMYNDTVNMLLTPSDDGKSTSVFATSVSQIGGAYGDNGQNYYNIYQLFNSISWSSGYKLKNADSSCRKGAVP